MAIKNFEDVLAAQNGAYEPQRQFQWMLEVHGLNPDIQEVLQMSLRVGVLPTESNEEVEIPFLNGKVFVAGKAMYEGGSYTFNDYVDKNTAKRIIQWRRLVYNPETHKIGLAKDYKKQADLVLYGPDFTVERIWKLYGVWPQQANFGTLDMSSSDIVQIEVQLKYDRAIPDKGLK